LLDELWRAATVGDDHGADSTTRAEVFDPVRQAIGAESGDVPLALAGPLKNLIAKMAVLIASDSPVTWNSGSYAVAVQCPAAYKVRLVTLDRGTPNTLDIKC